MIERHEDNAPPPRGDQLIEGVEYHLQRADPTPERTKIVAELADRFDGIGDEQHAQAGGGSGRTHDANGGVEIVARCADRRRPRAHVVPVPRAATRQPVRTAPLFS